MLIEIFHGERIGRVVYVANRKTDDVGLKCVHLAAQVSEWMPPEAQIGHGHFVSRLARSGSDIGQSQREDRIGNPLAVR